MKNLQALEKTASWARGNFLVLRHARVAFIHYYIIIEFPLHRSRLNYSIEVAF